MKSGHVYSWFVVALATAVVVFAIILVGIKISWAWIVPDLFPGAVEGGLVVASISWWTAFKVAIWIGISVGILRGHYEVSSFARGIVGS